MKNLFAIICALSSISAVSGACNSNDDSTINSMCEEYSGECTSHLNEGGHAALADVKYGRFCGGGSSECELEPCNTIDEACQTHDICLVDNGINVNSEGVERCECDVNFVFDLALSIETAVLVSPGLTRPTELCDKEYYTKIDYNFPEEAIFAANFCCLVLSGVCEGDDDDGVPHVNATKLKKATRFCGTVDLVLPGDLALNCA
jgi:hypothetical protein